MTVLECSHSVSFLPFPTPIHTAEHSCYSEDLLDEYRNCWRNSTVNNHVEGDPCSSWLAYQLSTASIPLSHYLHDLLFQLLMKPKVNISKTVSTQETPAQIRRTPCLWDRPTTVEYFAQCLLLEHDCISFMLHLVECTVPLDVPGHSCCLMSKATWSKSGCSHNSPTCQRSLWNKVVVLAELLVYTSITIRIVTVFPGLSPYHKYKNTGWWEGISVTQTNNWGSPLASPNSAVWIWSHL